MPFVKIQNLAVDEKGAVRSGTASIVDTFYIAGRKYHSRQQVRESLGRVLWLGEGRRSGIFLSQRRGLVFYDADSDTFALVAPDDERLRACGEETRVCRHRIFGDAYWLLSCLAVSGLTDMLQECFPDQDFRARILCRLAHAVLHGTEHGGREPSASGSLLASLFPEAFAGQPEERGSFYRRLGEEARARAFFRAIAAGREAGSAVCIDIPHIFDDREKTFGRRSGLMLVADSASNLPLWFSVRSGPGASMDALRSAAADVRDLLGLDIGEYMLDAGYLTKDFVRDICADRTRHFTALMPVRKDFQYRDVYRDSVRPFMGKSKFEFRLFGRAYFGRKTEIELYGRELRGYVYVDLNRAARGAAAYERCAPEEVGEMGGFKRDWLSVRFGFFALVSTRDEQPGDMLASFLSALSLHAGLAEGGRGQLPDELWDAEAERGRILFSMLAESALGHVRRRMTDAGPLSAAAGGPAGDGRPDPAVLWERTQDLFCLDNGSGLALVDAPSPAAADCFALLGEKVPAALDLEAFRRKLGFR